MKDKRPVSRAELACTDHSGVIVVVNWHGGTAKLDIPSSECPACSRSIADFVRQVRDLGVPVTDRRTGTEVN